MSVYFAISNCSYGYVLLAHSQKGINALYIGNDAELLTEKIRQKCPQAIQVSDLQQLQGIMNQVIEYIEQPGLEMNFSLDLQGTDFQKRVWQTLLTIPAGKTFSYAQLAQKIGAPKSVRAVATACAANSIAVLIPCHRVIRSDGQLSGYRWGQNIKQVLLEKEKLNLINNSLHSPQFKTNLSACIE